MEPADRRAFAGALLMAAGNLSSASPSKWGQPDLHPSAIYDNLLPKAALIRLSPFGEKRRQECLRHSLHQREAGIPACPITQ